MSTHIPLSDWLSSAWARHADEPQAVADELKQRLDDAASDDDVDRLAHLAHHVFGEHLGAFGAGQQALMTLAHSAGKRGVLTAGGAAEAALQRYAASLALAKGGRDARPGLAAEDALRVGIMAATSLGPHDAERATVLFDQTLAQARTAALADSSPANRTLAAFANNLAGALADMPTRSTTHTALMLNAAQAARVYWEKAGTWLHVERAEYRLALCQRVAGNTAVAREHALQCLRIVAAHGGVALERFFGEEQLLLAEREAGHDSAAAESLARMEAAYAGLAAEDQAWCLASLTKVGGAAPVAHAPPPAP